MEIYLTEVKAKEFVIWRKRFLLSDNKVILAVE